MSEQELMAKIKELETQKSELEEENKQLKEMIENKIRTGNTTAYSIITNLIADKINKEIHADFNHVKQTQKRAMMEDLKWELHVRYANDLQKEHIEPAREFINNYVIDDFYKKPRYKG